MSERAKLHLGDNLAVLRTYPDSTFHSVVTDPPAGIGFLGKDWDTDRGGRAAWVGWMEERAREVYRVLRPGGYALVWSMPRTSHWTGWAWESAGFEPRDLIVHIQGQGFPKSKNLGKILRAAGYEGADDWEGFGTALKPSQEPWWLFRRPLVAATIAANIRAVGAGALNIDGCRIPITRPEPDSGAMFYRNRGLPMPENRTNYFGGPDRTVTSDPIPGGRWPANLTLAHSPGCVEGEGGCIDGCPVAELDRQSGILAPGSWVRTGGTRYFENRGADTQPEYLDVPNEAGGASRFFFTAKASKRERTAGGTVPNDHPTVKPVALMRYLCRLVTPKGGTVLDPFAGSGTTGVGAIEEGFGFVGIELDPESFGTARGRIEAVLGGTFETEDPSISALLGID